MDNIVELNIVRKPETPDEINCANGSALEPAPGVVNYLESLLDMAKSGQLISIAATGELHDGGLAQGYDVGDGSIFVLMAGCDYIKTGLIKLAFEEE